MLLIDQAAQPHSVQAPVDGIASPFSPIDVNRDPVMVSSSRNSFASALRPCSIASSDIRISTDVPQRKRSVRFMGVGEQQIDGHNSEHTGAFSINRSFSSHTYESSESLATRHSHKVSEKIEAIASKLSAANGPSTVVHRVSRTRLNQPYLDSDTATPLLRKSSGVSVSTTSSVSPQSRGVSATWSPAGTISTSATSFTSPVSSGSRRKHYSPDD